MSLFFYYLPSFPEIFKSGAYIVTECCQVISICMPCTPISQWLSSFFSAFIRTAAPDVALYQDLASWKPTDEKYVRLNLR